MAFLESHIPRQSQHGCRFYPVPQLATWGTFRKTIEAHLPDPCSCGSTVSVTEYIFLRTFRKWNHSVPNELHLALAFKSQITPLLQPIFSPLHPLAVYIQALNHKHSPLVSSGPVNSGSLWAGNKHLLHDDQSQEQMVKIRGSVVWDRFIKNNRNY